MIGSRGVQVISSRLSLGLCLYLLLLLLLLVHLVGDQLILQLLDSGRPPTTADSLCQLPFLQLHPLNGQSHVCDRVRGRVTSVEINFGGIGRTLLAPWARGTDPWHEGLRRVHSARM